MSWSEDGIERKLSWFEKMKINREVKKRDRERLERDKYKVLSKAFETSIMQIFYNK